MNGRVLLPVLIVIFNLVNLIRFNNFLQKILLLTFAIAKMVAVAQLVRASDCGSEGRRFEPG